MGVGSAPICAKRSATSLVPSTSVIARCRVAATAGGRLAGATMPNQVGTSKPDSPVRPRLGRRAAGGCAWPLGGGWGGGGGEGGGGVGGWEDDEPGRHVEAG